MIDSRTSYEVSSIFTDLRQIALNTSPADIGIQCADGETTVWGLLMETGYPKAVATLVALADGTASLYFSNGGGDPPPDNWLIVK